MLKIYLSGAISNLENQIKTITKLIKNERNAINIERDKRYKTINSLEKKQANIRDKIITLQNKKKKLFNVSISFSNILEDDRAGFETLKECVEYIKKQSDLRKKNGSKMEFIQIYINPDRKLKL